MDSTVERIKDKMCEKIIDTAEEIVTSEGEVTVRKILKKLGVSNRVFYNRFQNIEEVLDVVYTRTVVRVRESIEPKYDGVGDFFEFVTKAVENTLVLSYEIKQKFNHYVFASDSITKSNYEWYMKRINELFLYAKEHHLIHDDIDAETMSYAIWCFCRGYNADAVNRMEKEEALEKFRYSFSLLMKSLQ